MTIRYTVRPISDFGVFSGAIRRPNPFRATWSNTLKLLSTELDFLKATDVVFEIDVHEGDIRIDGMLRANAKVGHPGVRIAFGSKYGPLTYTSDRFAGRWSDDPPDWQINVRAIALSLEALRRVDRYGVTKRGEQYTGWKAIGAGPAIPLDGGMTEGQARQALCSAAGLDGPNGKQDVDLWKLARARAHPDRNGGHRDAWDQVEQAAKVLGLL